MFIIVGVIVLVMASLLVYLLACGVVGAVVVFYLIVWFEAVFV